MEDRNHAEITLVFLSGGYTAKSLLDDFENWSGGYSPNEVGPQTIDGYVESAIPLPVSKTIHMAFNDFGETDNTVQHLMQLWNYRN